MKINSDMKWYDFMGMIDELEAASQKPGDLYYRAAAMHRELLAIIDGQIMRAIAQHQEDAEEIERLEKELAFTNASLPSA